MFSGKEEDTIQFNTFDTTVLGLVNGHEAKSPTHRKRSHLKKTIESLDLDLHTPPELKAYHKMVYSIPLYEAIYAFWLQFPSGYFDVSTVHWTEPIEKKNGAVKSICESSTVLFFRGVQRKLTLRVTWRETSETFTETDHRYYTPALNPNAPGSFRTREITNQAGYSFEMLLDSRRTATATEEDFIKVVAEEFLKLRNNPDIFEKYGK